MVITEKVYLHVCPKQELCFEWCQVRLWIERALELWIEWELYTVPLRNQLVL